jgi:hypothetical protein
MFRVSTQDGGRRNSASKTARKSPPKRKSGRKSPSKRKSGHTSPSKRTSGRKSGRKSPSKRKSGRKSGRKSPSKRKSGRRSPSKRKSGRKSGRRSPSKRKSQRGGDGHLRATAATNDRSYDFNKPVTADSRLFPRDSDYTRGVHNQSQANVNSRHASRNNMALDAIMIDNDCGWIDGARLNSTETARMKAVCARNVRDRLDNQFSRPNHADEINKLYNPASWTPVYRQKAANVARSVESGVYNYVAKPVASAVYNYAAKPVASAVYDSAKATGASVGRNARKHIREVVERGGETTMDH